MADRPPQHSPLKFIFIIAGLTSLIIIGMCLLPHSRFVRFNILTDAAVAKAGWIYQRIHYDQTPLDVVFVGTSHTLLGVDSALVEKDYRENTGRTLHVTNLALVHLGRDVHYLLAREALENRKVKLLVLEVMENEPRALHPAFSSLADAQDVLLAPLLINISYFSNLASLPLRQGRLFLRTAMPAAFGTMLDFVPANYPGEHWDNNFVVPEPNNRSTRSVVPPPKPLTPAELEQQRVHYERMQTRKLSLPSALRHFEQRANLSYVRLILELARQGGVPVRFLYLPQYGVTTAPEQSDTYLRYGPIWSPVTLLGDAKLWSDINHLNQAGARVLAPWLAGQIAAALPD